MPRQSQQIDGEVSRADDKAPGAPRALKQERSAGTREKLLIAATQLIAEKGYAAVSTPVVAERAQVSRGALQYHFPTRDDLLFAIRRRIADLIGGNISLEKLLSRPVEARVSDIVDEYWRFMGSDDYVAALEIRLYERYNAKLHHLLVEDLRAVTIARDHDWVRIFADATAATETIVKTRRFMLDVLRGFALRRIEEGPATAFDWEIVQLKAMLTRELLGQK